MKVNLGVLSPIKTSVKNLFTKGAVQKNVAAKCMLPLVATPLVVYDIYNTKARNLLNDLKEAEIKVPKNLSVSPISNSGLDEASKGKIRREIEKAFRENKIDEKTKNKLISEVNFTGRPDELAGMDGVGVDGDIPFVGGIEDLPDVPDIPFDVGADVLDPTDIAGDAAEHAETAMDVIKDIIGEVIDVCG